MRFTFVSGFKGLTVAWSVTLAAYAAYAQEATLPYETDFEASEGVVTGVASELPEWEFLGDVSTSVSNDSGSGLQALELISAGTAQLNVDGSMMPTIGWFDFLTKPVVVAEEGLPESIQPYQASVTGFVDLSGEGWIYVVDGDGLGGGEWVSVGSAFTLNGQVADSWMRLTYRLDYTNKLWDLYVDGKFVSTDLGFLDDTVDTLNHFRISSDPDDTTGLDFLYAGIDNPLYLDTSNDGLPDSWLIDQGLNTSENQRYSDTDFDGLSALDEFGLGTRADNADTDFDGVPDGREVEMGESPTLNGNYILEPLPFVYGFEVDPLGPFLSQNGWDVSGDARIQSESVNSGLRALVLSPSTEVSLLVDGVDHAETWVDFWANPATVASVGEIAFMSPYDFVFDAEGQIWGLNGLDGSGFPRWTQLTAASHHGWRRVTQRFDFVNQEYDLYLDGRRLASGLSFSAAEPFLNILTLDGERWSLIDDINISANEPGELDNDRDGWVNSRELLIEGTDSELFDTDDDGLADSLEPVWSMDPFVADSSLGQLVEKSAGSGEFDWGATFDVVDGFVVGPLHEQSDWSATDGAVVENDSVRLNQSETEPVSMDHLFGVGETWQIWVSFNARFSAGELPDLSVNTEPKVAVWGASASTSLSVWDDTSNSWTAYSVQSDTTEWNTYAVYLDYINQKWLLTQNGILVAENLPFIDKDLVVFSRFKALLESLVLEEGQEPDVAELDNLLVSTTAPSYLDYDGDGILNTDEVANGLDIYDAADAWADLDDDGLNNAEEIVIGSNIRVSDTDGDLVDDATEVRLARSAVDASDFDNDFDGDGMPDLFELNEGLDPFDLIDASLDTDSDALTNLEEYTFGTSLQSADSDTDQFSDGFEVIHGFDPLSSLSKPKDSDEDGWYDFDEVDAGSDPGNAGSSPGDQIFALDFEQGLLNDQVQAPFYINRYRIRSGFVSNSSAQVRGHWRDGGLKYPIEGNFSKDTGTFSIWVQIRQNSGAFVGDYLWEPIIEAGSWFYKDGLNPAPYLALVLHRETKLVGVKTEPGDGGPPSGIQHFQPIDWESHEWHNVAITWEGSALKLYVDGITVFETNTWHGLDEMPSELGFNTTQTLIDDVTVYNRALTPSEILDIYEKDTDQDTLPDVWEINNAGGIVILGDALADPDNDGLSNAIEAERRLSPVNADTDQDGLDDFAELHEYMTDPLDLDTDRDGVSDKIEVDLGLNPLVEDSDSDGIKDLIAARVLESAMQNSSVALLRSTQGSGHLESKGRIFDVADKVYATGERAELSYAIELPEAGIYQLRILAHQNHQYVSHENADFETIKETWIYWDEELIDIVSFNRAYGNDSDEAFMLPFSEAGTHVLKVFFADGIHADGHIIFEKIDLETYQGDDLDVDGQVDWLRSYAEVTNDVEPESLTSYFNPFYVRGGQRGTTLPMANGIPVTSVSGNTWVFPVDLSSGNLDLDVVFDDYTITRSIIAQWIPFDLLDENAPSEILVPAGTTVRFKAEDLAGGSEAVIINIAGELNSFSLGIGEVLEWGAGLESRDVLVEATCEAGLTKQLIVKVVNAGITDNSLNIRTHSDTQKTFEANVGSLIFGYDPTLEVLNEDSLGSADSLELNTDEAVTQSLDWRIPETGEVVGHASLNGYRIERGNEGYAKTIETYEDGSFLVEHQINMINLPAEITIEIDIFRAGVVFDDGTTYRTIDQNDFDDLGIYRYYMIVPANIGTTTCHRVKSYENGAYLETF